MGFGFYPDGSDQETNEPPKEIEKPVPVEDGTTPDVMPPHQEKLEPTFDQNLSMREYVEDTYHNATAVNVDRRGQIIADLKGYANGSEITVTYYLQMHPEADNKGMPNDIDLKKDRTHKNRKKIHNFKMRLLNSLQYEHDPAENINKLSGEAALYPGFNPNKGDVFIMEVQPGTWGMMSVTEIPQRMSIKSGTGFKIVFKLDHWMDKEVDAELEDHVIDEAWFDKQRTLNEPGALLYHSEYVAMKFLELNSARMLTYYNSKFIDRMIMGSYVRPDEVYDPYVTDFMFQIADFNESGLVAEQLFRDAPCMDFNIWRALLNQAVPLEAVPVGGTVARRTLKSKTVVANALINKLYFMWEPNSKSLAELFEEEDGGTDTTGSSVTLDDFDDADSDKIVGDLLLHIHPHYKECVISCNGCCNACGDCVTDDSNSALAYMLDGSDDFKKLIRDFFKKRSVNLEALMNCMKLAYKLPPIQQFYKMPIYIFLARTAVRYIHANAGVYE